MSLAHRDTLPTEHARRAVVVGVDGSDRNRAAIDWAAQEAESSARPLHLLWVLDDDVAIRHPSSVTHPDRDLAVLQDLAAGVGRDRPELTVHPTLTSGGPVTSLLTHAAEQRVLVVGRRGLGAVARLLIGSTSIAVAGRSVVPVVIVPDTWDPHAHHHEPVVVGVDPDDVRPDALTYALAEARRRGVRAIVVDCGAASGDADAAERSRTRLHEVIEPLRADFPGLHVELAHHDGRPVEALLAAAASAQLLVLGRRDGGRLGGFPVGSVTRRVLHHAVVPVAVVPDS